MNWADTTSADCSAKADAEIEVCVERAEEDIERCDEEEEERTRECNEWEWQGCDVPVVCDVAEAVVGGVCVGWTWVTHTACVASTVIPAGTCLVWETVKNAACQTGTWFVRGACEIGGAAARLVICPFVDFVSIRILRSRDEPKACSVPRLSADAMSVAHVDSELTFRDSGQRYFFRIRNGIAEFSTLTEDWQPIASAECRPQAISYRQTAPPSGQRPRAST